MYITMCKNTLIKKMPRAFTISRKEGNYVCNKMKKGSVSFLGISLGTLNKRNLVFLQHEVEA
jgi:hypothetical protein